LSLSFSLSFPFLSVSFLLAADENLAACMLSCQIGANQCDRELQPVNTSVAQNGDCTGRATFLARALTSVSVDGSCVARFNCLYFLQLSNWSSRSIRYL
jgi:hypothetical protein